MVRPEGMLWTAGKARGTAPKKDILISWSDELRQVIDSLKKLDGHIETPEDGLIFRTQADTRYTRHGWKATLRRLMDACEKRPKPGAFGSRGSTCRTSAPKGVTDKLEDGHTDVQDATLHKSARMIQAVYDRRRKVKAKPARCLSPPP